MKLYADEHCSAALADAAGIAAPLLYFDEADGTMLTGFVEGKPLDYDSFPTAARVTAAGQLYRRIHALGRFHGTYEIFPMIDGQRRKIVAGSSAIPAEFGDWAERIEAIRGMLAANEVPATATHNDPIPYNFVEHDGALTLLDWQCAAMADPHWEIGAFCAQVALSPALERTFLKAYFGRADHPGAARALLYKPVCHFYWLCVALAKLSADPQDQPAVEDVARTGKRLREALADKRTAEALARVKTLKWTMVAEQRATAAR